MRWAVILKVDATVWREELQGRRDDYVTGKNIVIQYLAPEQSPQLQPLRIEVYRDFSRDQQAILVTSDIGDFGGKLWEHFPGEMIVCVDYITQLQNHAWVAQVEQCLNVFVNERKDETGVRWEYRRGKPEKKEDKQVVVFCNSSQQASKAWTLLKDILRHKNIVHNTSKYKIVIPRYGMVHFTNVDDFPVCCRGLTIDIIVHPSYLHLDDFVGLKTMLRMK